MSYRIFGSENSPYSVKVRSYFRYKGIPHEWIVRTPESAGEYKKYAKPPIIPAIATPAGEGMQDSTPVIEALEAGHPEPSIWPPGAELRFLSELLEEFGDEWGNKWMFHFRWARDADQAEAARRLAAEAMPGLAPEAAEDLARSIRARMQGRGFAVGSNSRTAPFIEQNLRDFLACLEAHLEGRSFLFGGSPSLADFGIAPQLYEALLDPTAGAILRESPRARAWCLAMLRPEAAGPFETWATLQRTMEPLLGHAAIFLRWSSANARAVRAGAAEMEVDLGGFSWWQTVGSPQRYHEKSLRELRRKYQAVAGRASLDGALARAGCLQELGADPGAGPPARL